MSDQRRSKEDIFHTAAEINNPAERAAYLDGVCAADARLRAEIEELLEHDAEVGSFLQEPPGEVADLIDRNATADVPRTEPLTEGMVKQDGPTKETSAAVGDQVRYFGDYTLLEEIARGGMGVVYKARQVNLKRTVALKMILAGHFASEDDVRRFHAEARAAARLDHPGIVPIFEIGQHSGQHYFSMAFIEGKSLAHRVATGPLPVCEAATLIKKVTEAVAFAHVEGVIHRDLKPANVLMDRDGEPRVTDFGLAKRIATESLGEEAATTHAGLTATGQILGTPSYMPPEQARGRVDEVGPLSDVYSLGAMLYCLLAGRPPFQAANPLDTLMQVLHKEPVPLRQLAPEVPRDLETICLKCLEKEPARRYGSAQELADDLGRFLNDEPIQARPVGRVERTRRWLWKRRRNVATVAITAILSVVLLIGGMFGWRWYRESQLGQITMDTNGPALKAEVFHDDRNECVGEPFTVPTQKPVALRAGWYRMHLSAPNRLGQTVRVQVVRGQTRDLHFELDERKLWEPVAIGLREFAEVLEFEDGADLVIASQRGLRRIDGVTGQTVWESILAVEQQPALAAFQQFRWNQWVRLSSPPWRPSRRLIHPVRDLNNDGTDDLVVRGQQSPSILAISGKDGKVLWLYLSDPRIPRLPLPRGNRTVEDDWRNFALTGFGSQGFATTPVSLDVDGDGANDLVAVFHRNRVRRRAAGNGPPRVDLPAKSWIEAVSGKSGTQLWRYEIKQEQPSGKSRLLRSDLRTVRFGEKKAVMLVYGRSVVTLDRQAGKPLAPVYHVPSRPFPQQPEGHWLADVDEDRYTDVAFVFADEDGGRLATASVKKQSLLEGARMTGIDQLVLAQGESNDRAHVVADFNGDTRPEIATQDWMPDYMYRIQLKDVSSSSVRWEWQTRVRARSMGGSPDRCAALAAGPDINGDGHRELLSATLGVFEREKHRSVVHVVVDALSGRDGTHLWQWKQRVGTDGGTIQVVPLVWGERGPDGWPMLMVSFRHKDSPEQTQATFCLSASRGRRIHSLQAVFQPRLADFNGDGLRDLYWFDGGRDSVLAVRTIRGETPEAWRMFSHWGSLGWVPAQDFDSDGVNELVSTRSLFSSHLSMFGGATGINAISGRDGRVLWNSGIKGEHVASFAAPLGDFNQDGTSDVLVYNSEDKGDPLLSALSGKDGSRLWSCDQLVPRRQTPNLLECRDLDADGSAEVLVAFSQPSDSRSKNDLWMAAVAGRDGRVRWQERLGPQRDERRMQALSPVFADLNEDSVEDIIVAFALADESKWKCELRAIDGRDGQQLWSLAQFKDVRRGRANDWLPTPLVGDVDADGQPEVIAIRPDSKVENDYTFEFIVLAGKDGSLKWKCTWQNRRTRSKLPAMHLVRLAKNQPPLVAVIADRAGDKRPEQHDMLLIFNHKGEVEGRVAIPSFGWMPVTHVHDFDGDGSDELAYIYGHVKWEAGVPRSESRRVQVVRARDGKVLSDRPLPGGFGRILTILPAKNKTTATLVLAVDNDVWGIDGATGAPRWRCSGPSSGWVRHEADGRRFIHNALQPQMLRTASGLPRVLFHQQFEANQVPLTACRLPLPVGGDGKVRRPPR